MMTDPVARLEPESITTPGGKTPVRAFFFTSRTPKLEPLFGSVRDGRLDPTDVGIVVTRAWNVIGECHSEAVFDSYVLMPNHFHGIIMFDPEVQTLRTLGNLIGRFKNRASADAHRLPGSKDTPLWERYFEYESILDVEHLLHFRTVIERDPIRWREDPYYCHAGDATYLYKRRYPATGIALKA